MISFGTTNAGRYYDVFKINSDSITHVGKFAGAHTVLYRDINTDKLCLLYAYQGNFAFEKVSDYGALNLDLIWSGHVQSGEPYPSIPGTIVSFYNINDLTGIVNY